MVPAALSPSRMASSLLPGVCRWCLRRVSVALGHAPAEIRTDIPLLPPLACVPSVPRRTLQVWADEPDEGPTRAMVADVLLCFRVDLLCEEVHVTSALFSIQMRAPWFDTRGRPACRDSLQGVPTPLQPISSMCALAVVGAATPWTCTLHPASNGRPSWSCSRSPRCPAPTSGLLSPRAFAA